MLQRKLHIKIVKAKNAPKMHPCRLQVCRPNFSMELRPHFSVDMTEQISEFDYAQTVEDNTKLAGKQQFDGTVQVRDLLKKRFIHLQRSVD